MTKREEIREGVAERIYKWYFRNSQLNDWGEWSKVSSATRGMILAITDMVLEYENSQGIVIKVKCPDCCWSQFGDKVAGMTSCLSCNSTGYIIEPLIREGGKAHTEEVKS